MPVFAFNVGMSGSWGNISLFTHWNKYNPKYNFRSMK